MFNIYKTTVVIIVYSSFSDFIYLREIENPHDTIIVVRLVVQKLVYMTFKTIGLQPHVCLQSLAVSQMRRRGDCSVPKESCGLYNLFKIVFTKKHTLK